MKYIWMLILLMVIYVLINYKRWIVTYRINKAGKMGEKSSYKVLKKICKKKGYKIFKNIRIPLYDGSTEIDLLIVASYGILVIENKNLSGSVFGNIQDKNWYQLKKSGEKKTFYNPIMQNEGHIKCLNHNLIKMGIKNISILNFVVFSNEQCEINVCDKRIFMLHEMARWLSNKKIKNSNRINIKKISEIIKEIKIN
ncbi:nuclease-related domain-containing protein [Oceanirhabdus sp. W0125-5]|uniref:nuclease-related domain-containing protein n=1 Tax=Oceanirhabdus sp. W0125-5 TaxID=2999116 RepID=UPI0022F2AA7F|nr:nuclease-related domain-containing protein [Oceanirhabdus sp. W0125-5]WBW99153.1 nuclease-related domain-containing protein [Oceanirhabdus sp. W0125-5]